MQGCLQHESLGCRRVCQLQRRRMQCLTVDPAAHTAVYIIAHDGEPNVLQVKPDLVGSSGVRPASHKRNAWLQY